MVLNVCPHQLRSRKASLGDASSECFRKVVHFALKEQAFGYNFLDHIVDDFLTDRAETVAFMLHEEAFSSFFNGF
jgi:hypothetical protein